ncbi:MAG: 3'-5' exonuclease [Muribaculaceae bacterium]|nr:3'-5' exonuclease [Muribaculaceae bacterium]
MELKLTKPLIFFDLETTGVNVLRDRIVEMTILKVYPDKEPVCKTFRFRPVDDNGNTMPIPEQASAVHGIVDEDVKNEKTFKERAAMLAETFRGCDIAGYNSNNFDIPLLSEEFSRAGVDFDFNDGKIRFIDVQAIFYKKEPRTLAAACRFYCGKDMEALGHGDPHSAQADTWATYEVLKAQLDKYPDLANNVESLSEYSRLKKTMDLAGRIAYDDKGVEVFAFGKYKDKSVVEIFKKEPSYYDWIKKGDFPGDTKKCFERLYFKSKGASGIEIK